MAGQAWQRCPGPVSESLLVLERRLAADPGSLADFELPLTAAERRVLRGRRSTACGRPVLLQLPREGALRPGDQLSDGSGAVRVTVVAAAEPLLRVQADSALALLQAAYHLGNRHVALELHPEELRLLDDAVLAAMLEARGLVLSRCREPFAPEGGAYGEAHHHSHSHSHSDSHP